MAKYQNPVHKVLDPGLNFTGVVVGADVAGGTFATFGPGGVPGAPSVRTADADDQIIGVFKYDAALGETVGILSGGQCSVIAGAAITAGQGVVANAAGRAVPAGAGVKGYGTAYTDGGAGDAVYIHFS